MKIEKEKIMIIIDDEKLQRMATKIIEYEKSVIKNPTIVENQKIQNIKKIIEAISDAIKID